MFVYALKKLKSTDLGQGHFIISCGLSSGFQGKQACPKLSVLHSPVMEYEGRNMNLSEKGFL